MATASTHSPASSTSSPLSADLTCLSLGSGVQRTEFYLGPVLSLVNASPVHNIREHLAKRVDTDDYYAVKILTLSSPAGDSSEDRQGKVLLHNEYSLLLFLQGLPGVVHQHGLYREQDKIILVFDCIHSHNYDGEGRYSNLMNLQQYIVKQKRLKEREALPIFLTILTTIDAVHKKNIVHRDLKLGNVVLNTRTQEVTIINFALGKHLVREDDLLTDQRGSLAYVSPDVISGEPYAGKPSDMWSLGVLLYTMLYGQFPFYDKEPQELFRKIRLGKISLSQDGHVSVETNQFIRQLIEPDPSKRLTAGVALETMLSIISRRSFTLVSEPVQVVPEVDASQDTECIVPDQNHHQPHSLPTAITGTVDLTTPRLSLNPFLLPEQQANRVWFHQASPGTIASSPVSSPTTQVFFPDILPNHIVLHSTVASGNPFICSVPPNMSHRSASYSIPHTQNNNGAQYISQSLPVSLTATNGLFSMTSSPNSDSPQQELSYPMDTTSAANIHHHSHTLSPPSSSTLTVPTHRHSFSEGDHTLASMRPTAQHSHPTPIHLHGRRSLGSMIAPTSRQRRSSQHSPSRGSTHSLGRESPRQRRRSHDPSENHNGILENLQMTAQRVSPANYNPNTDSNR